MKRPWCCSSQQGWWTRTFATREAAEKWRDEYADPTWVVYLRAYKGDQ